MIRIQIATVALIFVILDTAPPPTIGIPGEITALGKDLVLAGVVFYFYRQIAIEFRKIVQDNAAALQRLTDKLEIIQPCPFNLKPPHGLPPGDKPV